MVDSVGHRHLRGLLKGALQLLIRLLLHSLSVLEFFDELHLELLHLHDLLFFLLAQVFFVADAVFVCLLHLLDSPVSVFLNFHLSDSLLLVHNLILHAVFLLNLEVVELLFLVVLLLDHLRLLSFLAL